MLLRAMYAGMVILLCVACVAVIRPDVFRGETARKTEEETVSVSATYDPITQFRIEREQLRSMQLAELDNMINSESITEEMQRIAQEEKLDVLRRCEIEETIGSILRARGFEGAAACAEDELVTVLIYSADPAEAEIAIITEQAASLSGISAGNIKIIPIN